MSTTNNTRRRGHRTTPSVTLAAVPTATGAAVPIAATATAAASTVTSTARHIRSATLTYISTKEELIKSYADEYRSRVIAFMEEKEERLFEVAETAVERYRYAANIGVDRLLSFEELPREWQENQYILTGYRFVASKKECLLSIFRLHNETGNIWTHLLGALFVLCIAIYCHLNQLPQATLGDHFIFLFFFIAATKCLCCSVLFHTFTCHVRLTVMKRAATLDYIGISLLISASVMVTAYYGFYCDESLARLYMTTAGIVGAIGFVLPWFDWFDSKEFRLVRTGIFVLMGGAGLFPLLHLINSRGLEATFHFITPLFWSLAMYLSGVFVYANHYPERLFPGWFDRWGSSHQFWHMFVVAGIWYQYRASLHYHAHRFSYGCMAH
ncbi:hemolysin-III related-domain-containing protein [Syncephalis fuscata]|nr:hemolysin-III related-domain-containing protein [Syncephalis fuscata]